MDVGGRISTASPLTQLDSFFCKQLCCGYLRPLARFVSSSLSLPRNKKTQHLPFTTNHSTISNHRTYDTHNALHTPNPAAGSPLHTMRPRGPRPHERRRNPSPLETRRIRGRLPAQRRGLLRPGLVALAVSQERGTLFRAPLPPPLNPSHHPHYLFPAFLADSSDSSRQPSTPPNPTATPPPPGPCSTAAATAAPSSRSPPTSGPCHPTFSPAKRP